MHSSLEQVTGNKGPAGAGADSGGSAGQPADSAKVLNPFLFSPDGVVLDFR